MRQAIIDKVTKEELESIVANSICGQLPIWNSKELTLTLDYINRNNKDNRLSNLSWVCPNCDRQLDTFAGKNLVKHNK